MFVKPAPGLKVQHPVTRQIIPESGLEVPDGDTYWTRRLKSGDVVQIQQIPEAKSAKVKP